jgi:hypothetical protein
VTEVAARVGEVRTRKAAFATEASAHMPTAEASAHVTAAQATTAYMTAAEATAHVAAAEPATVSATATAATARKCISGQSPCESRSHSQNNHGFAYHLTAPSTRLRVRSTGFITRILCAALPLRCILQCNYLTGGDFMGIAPIGLVLSKIAATVDFFLRGRCRRVVQTGWKSSISCLYRRLCFKP